ncbi:hypothetical protein THASP1DRAFT_28052 [Thamnocephalis sphaerospora]|uniref:Uncharacterized protein n=1 Tax=Thamnocephalis sphaerospora TaxID=78915 RepID=A0A4P9XV82_9FUNG|nr:hypothetical protein THASP1DRAFT_28052 [Thamnocephalis sphaerospora]|eukprot:RKP10177.1 hypothetical protein THASP1DRAFT_28052 [Thamnocephalis sphaerospora]
MPAYGWPKCVVAQAGRVEAARMPAALYGHAAEYAPFAASTTPSQVACPVVETGADDAKPATTPTAEYPPALRAGINRTRTQSLILQRSSSMPTETTTTVQERRKTVKPGPTFQCMFEEANTFVASGILTTKTLTTSTMPSSAITATTTGVNMADWSATGRTLLAGLETRIR